MAESAIRIRGARELQRAFTALNSNLGAGIKEALENAAEPVRGSAQNNVLMGISGMQKSALPRHVPWHKMRIGTVGNVVYVAPEQRGRRTAGNRKRRKLADLMAPLMEQALEQNKAQVESEVLDTLDELFRAWERVG